MSDKRFFRGLLIFAVVVLLASFAYIASTEKTHASTMNPMTQQAHLN